jgi:hypothetical protein
MFSGGLDLDLACALGVIGRSCCRQAPAIDVVSREIPDYSRFLQKNEHWT